MKHNIRAMAIALTAAAAVAVTSCTGTDQGKTATLAFDTYTGSAAYRLEGSAADFGQDKDIVYFDSVSLILPLHLGKCDVQALRDSITSLALDVKGKPIVQSINHWLNASADEQRYKAVKLDDPGAGDYAQGYDYVNGYVANLSPDMLVYCVRCENYPAGDAHPMSTRNYINYSLEGKGTIITLQKLFTADGLAALPQLIAGQAQSMSDFIGATTVTELPDDGNFYISSEGEIVFAYQPMEIAAYSEGPVDIPFYPYELAEYMTPYGIALFNLQDLNN